MNMFNFIKKCALNETAWISSFVRHSILWTIFSYILHVGTMKQQRLTFIKNQIFMTTLTLMIMKPNKWWWQWQHWWWWRLGGETESTTIMMTIFLRRWESKTAVEAARNVSDCRAFSHQSHQSPMHYSVSFTNTQEHK